MKSLCHWLLFIYFFLFLLLKLKRAMGFSSLNWFYFQYIAVFSFLCRYGKERKKKSRPVMYPDLINTHTKMRSISTLKLMVFYRLTWSSCYSGGWSFKYSEVVLSENVYFSQLYYLIVTVIKSRGLRWAGHVARMEEGRSAFKILAGKPTGKN